MTNTTQVDVARDAGEALLDADYSDAFRTASPSFFTAEDWARAAFEPVPGRTFTAQQRVWRRVLQLRLGTLLEAHCDNSLHTFQRLVIDRDTNLGLPVLLAEIQVPIGAR